MVVAAAHDEQTERLLSGLQSLGSSIAKAIKDQPTQDDQLSKSPRRKKQQMSEQRKEVRAATTLQLSQLLNNMPNSGSTASDAGSA